MKKIFSNLLMLFGLLFAFTACSDSNISDLILDGDCSVTAFALDDYEGTINETNRTITVNVPETFNAEQMAITTLQLSNGATSNMSVGEKMDMSTPHVIHVKNGNVYLDWTIRVVHDEARITSFKINDTYTGVINQDAKTISVYVPNNLDIKNLIPTIVYSQGASITPASGIATDFTNPVTYTLENNTAKATYTVTVTPINKPSALYVGLAPTMSDLNVEEQTACTWMLENIPNSLYASFDDITNGNIDLSECKVIWWHFHKDGGVDGKEAFQAAAPSAINAAVKLRDYYENGGSFLFTRYATNMPAFIGAVKNDGCPNNCWGQNEAEAETVGGPWEFGITGHTDHPLFQNLIQGDLSDHVYTCDKGYRITNSTAQWHIGSDWGDYTDIDSWRNKTGAIDLGHGGDGAVVAWEFPATNTKGDILCIGSGCYDWYSVTPVADGTFHDNVARMTLNAFNYLMNK